MSYLETLETVASEVVASHADAVDAEARFPAESLEALGKAGLLGLVSASEVGGLGLGPAAAVRVIERLAQECGSTAMVTTMHYAGTTVVEQHGSEEVRRDLASGARLTTLAFSEAGSRSHFWAPTSTATASGAGVVLDAKKSWVTSATRATDYVWSSKPSVGSEASTLWLVSARSEGLSTPVPFNGLGLRGNDSRPVRAIGVKVPLERRLGGEGEGFGIMMGTVLPAFNLMIAAGSLGLMSGGLKRTLAHVTSARYEHLGTTLADLPTIRAYVARMQIKTDMVRALLYDAAEAVEAGREDAMLRVLESKAAAGETAGEVLELGMRVCGGQAFRRDVGVERVFRDAKAAGVMAPTTDQLYDFIGKAICGQDLF